MWRSLSRHAALSFAVVVGALVLHAVLSLVQFSLDARAAQAHLGDALASFERAELPDAQRSLLAAAVAADRAQRDLAAPSLIPFRLGALTDDFAALSTLTEVAGDVAAAGSSFVVAADVGELGDVYDAGRLDLEALDRLHRASIALSADLGALSATLDDAAAADIGFIERRVTQSERRLDRARDGLERAAAFFEMAPAFSGASGPRRYFVALQSPSEARGGGGLIGVYGILLADQGRFDLTHVGPIEELVRQGSKGAQPPRWFVESYGGFAALDDWRLANLSPHFPVTAELLLDMYEGTVGDELDGVIALDPLAIGELTRGTGPIEAAGWERAITRDNARRVLLHDIYRHFDYQESLQNAYLNRLIDAFWDALESDRVKPAGLLRGLSVAAATQHLKVYVRDDAVMSAIAELGADGDYTRAGDAVQLVFNNNFSANKVDFFLKRTVATEVALARGGGARVTVRVELRNEAPEEDRSVLVRPLDRALPFGTNRMLLGLIAPRGSRFGNVTIGGRSVAAPEVTEEDYPLVQQVVEVASGETEVVTLRYRWPEAWDPATGAFELTLWPQGTVRPDFYSLTVTAPEGVNLAHGAAPLRVEGRLQKPVTTETQVLLRQIASPLTEPRS